MPIDIRAEVSCSLGTVISGSFADDYLQGNGLIKTRGEVVLDGTQTPEVGTEVTFTYAKAGNTYTVPRVLRVLSSFADPFRRTTTVQLGCKLTYLENRKPPVENPSSKDENADVPCKVFLKATLPITAEYVFQQCLDALQLDAASIPLTNKFSVEEFDLTPGYVQVMSDLLQSEGYAGYLDSEETLQFLDLTEEASTGPVITPSDVVDLGPIGSGELPGESVVVRWSNLRLLPPDELYGDEYLKRSWEIEEVFGAETEVSVSYTDDEGNTVSEIDVFYPYTFSATRYDVWDRKIESISLNLVSSAETNNRWASDAFRLGRLWNRPTARLTREVVEYEKAAAAANSVDFGTISEVGKGVPFIKAQLSSAAEAHTGLANLCKEEVPEGADVVKSQTTFNYFSELELAGSLNIDTYISVGGFGNQSSLVEFDTIAAELDSFVIVEYETDTSSGISKTITKRFVSRSQTVSGQQDLATRAQEVDTLDLTNSIGSLLGLARRQVYVGAETSLHTQREYGLQKRPSEAERNNTANSKPQVSESKAEITWIVGSTTSTAVTEFTLPYAPDDAISWNETTGEFSSTPSDAEQKAMRYGRVQNALLLGNRNGVSLQLAPDQLPKRPFDPLYLQAGGITGAYRVNGTSWAFDANGIVASTDALLWGAVSAASGTNLASSWVPLAPGTTSLPLPYTPTSSGTDSETGVSYSAVITPTVVLAPYLESVKVEGISRSSVALTDYPYTLDRGTETQVAATKSKVLIGSKVVADVGALVLSGQAAGGSYSRKLIGAAGSFAITGYGAGSIRDYRIGTNAGTLTFSGQSAILLYQRAALAGAAGSFELAGQDAGSRVAISLIADAGSFALSGQDARTLRSRLFLVSAVSFSAIGQDATLTLPPPADPYAANVSLLLHMDGANGSTTFTDKSNSAHTITANGNAQVTTSQSVFGGGSVAFDGTDTAFLTVPDSPDWTFGTSDFTIEMWVRFNATNVGPNGGYALLGVYDGSEFAWGVWSSTGTNILFGHPGGNQGPSWTPALNTWYHLAVSRSYSSNWVKLFIDGVQVGSDVTGVLSLPDKANDLSIGGYAQTFSGGTPVTMRRYMNGYIDELRITKGVARYTANFTPPTAAFPDPPQLFQMPAATGSFALSGSPVAGLGYTVSSGNAEPLLGNIEATSTTGWTQLVSNYFDDSFVASGSFGFTFSLAGSDYTSCFIGSNGYLTFGSGSSVYSGVGPGNPALPKVMFNPGDRSYTRIYVLAGSDGSGNYFRIRWEGSGSAANQLTNFAEIALFKAGSGQQFVEVRYGNFSSGNLPTAVGSASAYYASVNALTNTSVVFTGNATGTSWSVTNNAYVNS